MAAESVHYDGNIGIPYYETVPSYEEFWKNHLIPNKPCVIGPALTENWKARKEWIIPTNSTLDHEPQFKPNYEYLRSAFGKAIGQVAKCDKRHFTDQERLDMSIKEFIDLWEADDGKESVYYLKDLHLMKLFPEDNFYTVPELFQDDWLNKYWGQEGNDDYKFSYMGGHDTFTPFHADVYKSYSWSSNICGIKKWTLFPPNQESLYKDKFGNMIYDIRKVDPVEFPNFEKAKKIVLYQKDGETLFVPSGWYHQVENIGPSISLNHNWINSNNVFVSYLSLKKDLNDCEKAIEDIKDEMTEIEFINECQQLLLVHSGWEWKIFLNILYCIVHNRRISLDNTNQPPIKYQMDQIQKVLKEWISTQVIDYFKQHDLYSMYNELLDDILFINNK